jgi:hypothetical protein
MITFHVKSLETTTFDEVRRRYSLNLNLSAATPKELVDQLNLVAHTVQHYTDNSSGQVDSAQ